MITEKIVAIDTVSNLKKLVTSKANPTMEDVFLSVTGREIRDAANSTVKSTAGPGRHFSKPNNRVR